MKKEVKEKREKRNKIGKVLYNILWSIIIVIGIIGSIILCNYLWPENYTEEEIEYYREVSSNVWDNGVKSIKNEITTSFFDESNLIFHGKFGKVKIVLGNISDNEIKISSTKKGYINFYFSDSETVPQYDYNSVENIGNFISFAIIMLFLSIVFSIFATVIMGFFEELLKKKKPNYIEGINPIVPKKGL